MKNKYFISKSLNILTLIIGLIFVILALYACFFVKRASLEILIMTILFFGAGVVVTIIDMKSKRKEMIAKGEDLPKKQSFADVICGLIFSVCSLWAAISGKMNNNYFIRVIPFMGFLFFFIGSIWLFVREQRVEE